MNNNKLTVVEIIKLLHIETDGKATYVDEHKWPKRAWLHKRTGQNKEKKFEAGTGTKVAREDMKKKCKVKSDWK
jgi:hypothetical protein